MVSDVSQSHLLPACRSQRPGRQRESAETALPEPGALRGLRRLRIRVSGTGPAGSVRDERGREPVEVQPDPAAAAEEESMRKAAWLILVAAIAVGCSRQPQASFPEQASGWAKQGEARTFTAENLYEYIDGDAEKYLAAGVKQTLTADYKFQGKFDAVADVFIMGNAEGARKVFESQADVGSKSVPLGDAGRV